MNHPISAFGKVLKSLGFQKRTSNLFYIENKDAFCFIYMECPTIGVHINFGVLPVYLPPKGFYMNYGWRLESRYSLFRFVRKDDSYDKIMRYCVEFEKIVCNDLLPLIHSLSTAEEIMNYYKNNGYLAAYTKLYLQQFTEAKEAAESYLSWLSTAAYTQKSKDELRMEMEKIIYYSTEGKSCVDKVFADWRLENSSIFRRP